MKKFLERLNGLIMLSMLVITVSMVFCRIVLRQSATWGEGIGQLILVFVCFIGSAAIMKDESHIKITILSDKLKGKSKLVLDTFNRLCTLIFLVVLILGSWKGTVKNWEVNDPIIAWMKSGYLYLVLLLSSGIMAYYTIWNAITDFKGLNKIDAKEVE